MEWSKSSASSKIKSMDFKKLIWANVTKAADMYRSSAGPTRVVVMEYMKQQVEWFERLVDAELKRQSSE